MATLAKVSRWTPLWDPNDPRFVDESCFVVPDILLDGGLSEMAGHDDEYRERRLRPWGSSLERVLDLEWRCFGAAFALTDISPDTPPFQALRKFAHAVARLRELSGGAPNGEMCHALVTDSPELRTFLHAMLEYMNEYPGDFSAGKPHREGAEIWRAFSQASRIARAPVAPLEGTSSTNRSTKPTTTTKE